MQMGFLGGLTVAGLIMLAALTGVVFVKMTTNGAGHDMAAYAAVAPSQPPVVTSQPALVVNPLTGKPTFARNCNGAIAEAKTIGVLPEYAKISSPAPRTSGGENVCSAQTQSAQWDVAYYSRCTDGGDSCHVLARVTQQGQFVVFKRD